MPRNIPRVELPSNFGNFCPEKYLQSLQFHQRGPPLHGRGGSLQFTFHQSLQFQQCGLPSPPGEGGGPLSSVSTTDFQIHSEVLRHPSGGGRHLSPVLAQRISEFLFSPSSPVRFGSNGEKISEHSKAPFSWSCTPLINFVLKGQKNSDFSDKSEKALEQNFGYDYDIMHQGGQKCSLAFGGDF